MNTQNTTALVLPLTQPVEVLVKYGTEILRGWLAPAFIRGSGLPVLIRADGRGWALTPDELEALGTSLQGFPTPAEITGWWLTMDDLRGAKVITPKVIQVGDRVMLGRASEFTTARPGSLGLVIAFGAGDDVDVYFDPGAFSHEGLEFPIKQLVERSVLEKVPAGAVMARWSSKDIEAAAMKAPKPAPVAPKMPTAPMTKAVLEVLQAKGSLTGLEAGGVLKCRSLPKRICELKALGWKIGVVYKMDPRDRQRYAHYSLAKAA